MYSLVTHTGDLAPEIRVTGSQRSGHNFIALLLCTMHRISWFKQHAKRDMWDIKVLTHNEKHGYNLLTAGPIMDERSLSEPMDVWESEFAWKRISINDVEHDLRAIRVTEYKDKQSLIFEAERSPSNLRLVVFRDPRNLLASAIGKGWSLEACRNLMEANEMQYKTPLLSDYIPVYYEEVLTSLSSPLTKSIRIGPFTCPPDLIPALRAIQQKSGNSSFAHTGDIQAFARRYERPDVTSSQIWKELRNAAEDLSIEYTAGRESARQITENAKGREGA